MNTGATLRARLARGTLVAPGAYDALSARMARLAGAEAIYMTGFGVAGSLLGVPDIGLVTATEMADRVEALSQAAAPVPLIADGDNGHGSVLNVERLVRLYERNGAACIQLEDQVMPKRCGHMEGKEVVSLEEGAAKVRAAVAARSSRDFLIMARTDARSIHGLDEVCRRGDAYLAAGADLLFVEAPQDMEELVSIASRFRGAKLVANMVEDGKTPLIDAGTLSGMGYSLVLFPVSALLKAGHVLRQAYAHLLGGQSLQADSERLSFAEYNEAMGLSEYLERTRHMLKDG